MSEPRTINAFSRARTSKSRGGRHRQVVVTQQERPLGIMRFLGRLVVGAIIGVLVVIAITAWGLSMILSPNNDAPTDSPTVPPTITQDETPNSVQVPPVRSAPAPVPPPLATIPPAGSIEPMTPIG